MEADPEGEVVGMASPRGEQPGCSRQTDTAAEPDGPAVSSEISSTSATQGFGSRDRGRRGGSGRGRGSTAAQTSTIVSRRAFGGGLTAQADDQPTRPPATGLSGDAAEFVPGQPLCLPGETIISRHPNIEILHVYTPVGTPVLLLLRGSGRNLLPRCSQNLRRRTCRHESMRISIMATMNV